MKPLISVLENFGRTTGDYWSKDNAQFEASNPNLVDRVGRALNPLTGFGSALGAMSDAASEGFPPLATALALWQAIPVFGAVRSVATPAVGAIKAGTKLIDSSLEKALLNAVVSSSVDGAVEGNNREKRKGN